MVSLTACTLANAVEAWNGGGMHPLPLDAGRQGGLQALIISILLRRVDGVTAITTLRAVSPSAPPRRKRPQWPGHPRCRHDQIRWRSGRMEQASRRSARSTPASPLHPDLPLPLTSQQRKSPVTECPIRLISRAAEASARPGPPSPGCWRAPFVVNSLGVMSRFGAGTYEPRRESGRAPGPPVQMRHIAHPPSGC